MVIVSGFLAMPRLRTRFPSWISKSGQEQVHHLGQVIQLPEQLRITTI